MAGSISRLINRIGVNDPIKDAKDTARVIPSPTIQPSTGLVFRRVSEVRKTKLPHKTPKIMPTNTPTEISLLTTR